MPTVSSTTSYRSVTDARSVVVWSMTWSAPRLRTRSALAPLVTPVTVAPTCFASWTALVPIAPDAPLTRTRVPGPTVALSRRKNSAVVPPKSTPAASSWLTPAGFATTRDAGTTAYSACVPIRRPVVPATSSPTAMPVTLEPSASTTPENVLPRTVRRGRRSPKASRANGSEAAREPGAPDAGVGGGDRGGVHPHEHVLRTGDGGVDVDDPDDARCAVLVDDCCSHVGLPYACKS